MARKTVRVDLPVEDAKAMVGLFSAILKQHKKLGAASPITDAIVKMASYATRAEQVATLQGEIEELQAELEQKLGSRDMLIGIAEGQNAQSAGTLYFETLQLRDLLLAINRGNEQALEAWGYHVAIGTAKAPQRKKTASSAT